MSKTEDKFHEQEAPVKNTDNAFVKVGKDGSPSMPDVDEEQRRSKENEELKKDSLKHR